MSTITSAGVRTVYVLSACGHWWTEIHQAGTLSSERPCPVQPDHRGNFGVTYVPLIVAMNGGSDTPIADSVALDYPIQPLTLSA